MKEVPNIVVRTLSPKNNAPLLVPSFCNGGATATQSGYTITVSCVNAHNIPSTAASRISNYGVKVFLLFYDAVGIPVGTPPTNILIPTDISTQWYSNIIVTSTTTFTCTSTISQTVTTPVTLYASAAQYHLTELGIDVPGGLLKAGSSITYNAFIERAVLATTRTTYYAVGPISFYNKSYLVNTSQWNQFGGDAMSGSTDNNRVFYKKIGFFGDVNYLADTVDFIGTRYSDSISTRYSPGGGDTLTAGRNLSTNDRPLSLQEGFIFMPTIQFDAQSVLNDYVLWNMSRLEVNI